MLSCDYQSQVICVFLSQLRCDIHSQNSAKCLRSKIDPKNLPNFFQHGSKRFLPDFRKNPSNFLTVKRKEKVQNPCGFGINFFICVVQFSTCIRGYISRLQGNYRTSMCSSGTQLLSRKDKVNFPSSCLMFMCPLCFSTHRFTFFKP